MGRGALEGAPLPRVRVAAHAAFAGRTRSHAAPSTSSLSRALSGVAERVGAPVPSAVLPSRLTVAHHELTTGRSVRRFVVQLCRGIVHPCTTLRSTSTGLRALRRWHGRRIPAGGAAARLSPPSRPRRFFPFFRAQTWRRAIRRDAGTRRVRRDQSSDASADSSSDRAWASPFFLACSMPASSHARASSVREISSSICPHIKYIAT
jgi:hypothetical protein